jgi:hypothetical protein
MTTDTPCTPVVQCEIVQDPHIEWAARAHRLQAEADTVADDDTRNRLIAEAAKLENAIARTPASTLDGVIEQLDLAAHLQRIGYSEVIEIAIRSARDTVRRIADSR